MGSVLLERNGSHTALGPSTKGGQGERQLSLNRTGRRRSTDAGSAWAMILDFSASRTRKTKRLLVSHRGYGLFVRAAQTDKDRASLRPLGHLVFHWSRLPDPKMSPDLPGLRIQGHILVHGNRQEGAQNLFSFPAGALFSGRGLGFLQLTKSYM